MNAQSNFSHLQAPLPIFSSVGDDVIVIFTLVVYSALCQAIAIFGIVTNIINIICFIKQGFKDSVSVGLIGLSVSDLCSLVTLTLTNVSFTLDVCATDLSFEPTEVNHVVSGTPHFTFTRVSSWITAIVTLERCLYIIAPLKIKNIVTPTLTAIIIVCVYGVLILSVMPVYFVNKLGMKFSPLRNKTIFGLVLVDDREKVESISYIINNFSISLSAFVIIVICTLIISMKLHSSTKWRKKCTTLNQVDTVSARNQAVVKMVVMISTLFIVCFSPVCITVLVVAFEPEFNFGGKYLNITLILVGVGFVLESINSSVNIFIYYSMSSRYRDCWRKIFLSTV